MDKKAIGNTNLYVTPVGFGVLTIGPWQMNLSVDLGASVLRYAIDNGINLLDTAQYYKTYPYIKKALKGYDKELVIVSKSLGSTYGEMKIAVEEARYEMDRESIEIFLLHEVRSRNDWLDRSGAWDYLQEAKAKGIVKAVGISTHHVDVAELAIRQSDIDILFPLINFQSLGIRKHEGPGCKEEMAAAMAAANNSGKGVFAMKVFGGGNLTGSYQEALNYIQGLPGIDAMMIGFGHKYEIDRILEYMDGSIDLNYVPELTHKKIQIDQGDCIGCLACVNRCPNKALFLNSCGKVSVDHTLCLTCGYCAPKCPVLAIIMF